MKKLKAIEVIIANDKMSGVLLTGAPIEDIKAVLRFRREAKPIVDAWESVKRDAIEKLKPAEGESVNEADLNTQLNEALKDEMLREVEITPFVLSEDGEAIILQQSKLATAELDAIKEILKDK